MGTHKDLYNDLMKKHTGGGDEGGSAHQSAGAGSTGSGYKQKYNDLMKELSDPVVRAVREVTRATANITKGVMQTPFAVKHNAHVNAVRKWYEAQKAEHEALITFDLNKGQEEIDELERRREGLLGPVTHTPTSYTSGGFAVVRTPYSEQRVTPESNRQAIKELDRQISEKKQYLGRAKRTQDYAALSAVTGNRDFWELSKYASTYTDSFWDNLTDSGHDAVYEYINNQNGYREEYERKNRLYSRDNWTDDGVSSFKEKGYDRLNNSEIEIYNYLYAKEGKETAQRYLDSIQETLNYRRASEMFEAIEGKTALEMAFGAKAGLDQWKQGTKTFLGGNAGKDYIPASATQMASGMVREDLADNGFKLPEWLGGASLGQVGYDVINTTANMAPSVLTATALNAVAPGSGAFAGNAMMFGSSAGNAYQEALNLGYDKGQAASYATLVGASEAGLQYLLGGISSMGGKVSGNSVKKMLSGVDNAFARVSLEFGSNMLSEGTEEGLQEVLTPLFKSMALHADEDIDWGQVAYSALLGALSGGLLEGPNAVANGTAAAVEARMYRQEQESSAKSMQPDNATAVLDNTADAAETAAEPVVNPVEAAVENVENHATQTADSSPAVEESAENAQSTRTIEEAARDFGEQAGAVVKYYEDGQDVERYVRGFRAAYDMGKSGISQDYALRSASAEGLTDHQRKQAWLTGKGAAALEAQRAGQTNAAKATGGTVRKKGTVRAEGVTLQELQAGFNDRQKSAYKLLSTYAEATGVDVVLYRSQADEDGGFTGDSGSYHWDTSTVRLDVNAGLSRGTDIGTLGKYTMMKTYSHEFTHFCEQWSPEQYDSFRQEVFTAMEENGENPADLIEELMAEYEDLDYDAASREVVAEAMVDILEDSDFISRIAQTDKTLFDKLREKIAEFVQKVRDYWKGMVTTNARGAVAVKEQVGENLKYLEKIQKLWDDMAVNAVDSYQRSVMTEETVTQPQARETAAEADHTTAKESSAVVKEPLTTVSEKETVAPAEEAAAEPVQELKKEAKPRKAAK